MAKVSPAHHARMAVSGVKAALTNWAKPRTPLSSGPPEITAKEALRQTRLAVADGVAVDERAFASAS